MKITVRYGKAEMLLPLPESVSTELLKSKSLGSLRDERQIIEEALASPIGSPPLGEFVQSSDRIAVIVSDKTRRCRTDVFLPILLEKLQATGVKDEAITILFANGTHALQSEEEEREIVGPVVYERYRVAEHDCRDEESPVYLGKTSRGTEVRINRIAASADKIIATGGISHHYFAGFGGGAKLIMPGIAALSTIQQNHKLTLVASGDFHPNCCDGILDGNPVYEDVVEAAKLLPPSLLFSTILDENGHIAYAVCGDLVKAHRVGARKVDEMYQVPIRQKADLVLVSCGGYPKDINFIQAHKSIQHAFYAVKEGGVIICLAECRDGIGSETFLEWFRFESEDEVKRNLLLHYTMNGHTALSLMKKLNKVRIILVTLLDKDIVARMGMIPVDSVHAAVEKARAFLPNDFGCYVLQNGSLCVPRLSTE